MCVFEFVSCVCFSLGRNTSKLNTPEDPCCVSGEVKENAKKHPSLWNWEKSWIGPFIHGQDQSSVLVSWKSLLLVFVLPCWQTKQQRDAVGEKKTPSGANIKTSRRQFIMDLLTAATSESESENCSDVPQINHTFPHLICRLFRDLMWRPDVRQVARLRWTNLPEIQVASKTRWVQFKAKSGLNT